jgi:hypothetical protein
MITKEDAVEIAARFLRKSGYLINSQEPTCRFIKKSEVLAHFNSPKALEVRALCPQAWDAMVEELARDRWELTFTVGEDHERVWQIIEVEVDDQTMEPSDGGVNPPPNPPKLKS